MTAASSPIARAIDELETEERNLEARLTKVREAITTLRALFHLPAAAKARTPTARTNGNGNGHPEADTAIRTALKSGPLSPGALATAVGLDRAALRYRIRLLERDGVLVSTGTTASRRVGLAGSPAKEAP